MTRPTQRRRTSAAALAVALAGALTLSGLSGLGGVAAAAQPGVRHTPREMAAFLAADRGRPAVPVTHAIGAGATGSTPLARPSLATLTATLSGPTLLYTQSAFVSATELSVGLVVKNLQTATISALLAPTTTACPYQARLSPDATKVVFLDLGPSCGQQHPTIDVLDVAAGTYQVIVSAPSTFLQLPNWNPASDTILYTDEIDDAGGFVSSSLFTVPAAGGSSTAVTGGGANAYDGVYSPNGAKIAYAPTVPETAHNLAVMDASGANVVNLMSTANVSSFSPIKPAWSPDASRLVYQYVKPASSGPLANGIGIVRLNDTGAGGFGVTGAALTNAYFASWSADGTEIYYDANTLTSSGEAATNDAVYSTDIVGHRRATLVSDGVHAYSSPSYSGDAIDTGSPSSYTPIAPARVQPQVPVGAGATIDVQVSGGASPVPAGATAVTLNLTGVSPTLGTYLQAYPKPASGNAVPLVSNLNLNPGQIAAVAVQVAVSSDGFVRIRNNNGTTGVVVDVSGYFTAGTTANLYSPITPVRALDTTLGEGGTTDVTVTGLGSVSGLTPVAVVLNLTAANPTKGTFLTVYPTPASPTDPPVVSNLNLLPHTNRANLVTAAIGASGKVRIRNAFGSVRAIADVVGFYGTGAAGGLAYYPLQPTRFMDTRYGTSTYLGSVAPLGAGATIPVGLRGTATTGSGTITVPATAAAFVYNLTAVSPTANTYLTAYPYGGARPLSSSVNAAPGKIVPNLAITGGDGSGQIGIYNFAGKTPVIIDLAGYYAVAP